MTELLTNQMVFTSEITVEEIHHVGNDEMLARAAWISTGKDIVAPDGKPITPEKIEGVLSFLMKNRHGTPFEHSQLCVRVHAPIKVWREWHRHRIAWSYNEMSGRYKDLDPIFYIPPRERPAIRPEGFKSSRPAFDVATDDEYECLVASLKAGYKAAYEQYEYMLKMQVDRGLARDVLGVGIYSACYCTANPRSIMHFLELRTTHPEAKRPSKPLYEIDVAANKLEAIFASHWPITYKLWNENGRCAP
jgi:thymidylate synthase (FAD)